MVISWAEMRQSRKPPDDGSAGMATSSISYAGQTLSTSFGTMTAPKDAAWRRWRSIVSAFDQGQQNVGTQFNIYNNHPSPADAARQTEPKVVASIPRPPPVG